MPLPFLLPLLTRFPLLKHWRYIAGGLLVVGVVWFAWAKINAYGDRRAAEIQAKWDKDEADEKAVADAETLKNKLEDAADDARNAQIAKDYAAKLAAADAANAQLAGLLRKATATASASRAGEGAGVPGTAEASPPGSNEPPDASPGIHQLIADALTEARQNAEQLDSLISQITPQM